MGMNPNDNLDPIIAMTSRPQSLQSAPGWVSGKRKYTKEYRTIVTTIPLYPNPLHNPQTRSSATNKNSGSTCPLRRGQSAFFFLFNVATPTTRSQHSLTLTTAAHHRPPSGGHSPAQLKNSCLREGGDRGGGGGVQPPALPAADTQPAPAAVEHHLQGHLR